MRPSAQHLHLMMFLRPHLKDEEGSYLQFIRISLSDYCDPYLSRLLLKKEAEHVSAHFFLDEDRLSAVT